MKFFDDYISALKTLVSFKSKESAPQKGAPYGKGVADAMNYFLSTAKELGFDTVDYDGYAGEVAFGEGDEIGIIGHLDVVPEGEGWETPPFVLAEKDGYYCGRGVLDDKGPLLAVLFALKEFEPKEVADFEKALGIDNSCNADYASNRAGD